MSSRLIVHAICLLALPATPVFAGNGNSLMDISVDGRLLACSNRDSGTVTIVDLTNHQRLREIPVGRHPEGVTFLGDSHRLAVAVYDDDRVVLIDSDSGDKLGAVDVFDEPYGVASNEDGSRVYVTLDYPGQVVEIDTRNKKLLRSIAAGPYARGIAYSATEKRLYVTEFYTSQIIALDLESGRIADRWPGISSDNLCRQITLNPRRPKAYIPHIRSRVGVAHGAGSIFPYVTAVDTKPTAKAGDKRRNRIPMDGFLANLVTANPWEVAISADGRQFYAIFAGTNDMFACQVVDDDYTELDLRRRIVLGNNPRAVRVAPDGETVYIYNALDFEVVAYSTKSLQVVGKIKVCENPLSEAHHRGKVLFYSALQPMVGRRWIACASCHPDGQPDGRTWQNPEGLRNTQSLAGLAWTHPVHWSADRDEVQDFEHTIRGPLMQGRGLIRGPVSDSLGDANRARSPDLDALATYTNSHRLTLSPHAKNGLSDAAKRGREVFYSAKTRCATCHSGAFYTDSQPRPADQLIRHDVGTGKDDPSEKMGPKFDTPSLLGVYRTAPYLHHGKALTLRDVLTTCNADDQHGVTSHLDDGQVDDLIEFLKALPFEDPLPQAKKERLLKVES